MFVDFLVTKNGLAQALQGHSAGSDALHRYFDDRLVSVCGSSRSAALGSVDAIPPVDAYNMLKGIGNLCIGAASDSRYDAEALVQSLISGLLIQRVR